NLDLLRALVEREEFATQAVHTRHVEQVIDALLARAAERAAAAGVRQARVGASESGQQGAQSMDVVAARAAFTEPGDSGDIPAGRKALRAPMSGRLLEVSAQPGDTVRAGQTVAVLEAMKMEHTVAAEQAGRVVELRAQAGNQVSEGQPLI